jgi:hypothetical protein
MNLEPMYYSLAVADIEMTIMYSAHFAKYRIQLKKDSEYYTPAETPLAAKSWDSLMKKVEIEMHTEAFQNFVEPPKRKEIVQAIVSSRKIFLNYP